MFWISLVHTQFTHKTVPLHHKWKNLGVNIDLSMLLLLLLLFLVLYTSKYNMSWADEEVASLTSNLKIFWLALNSEFKLLILIFLMSQVSTY